MRDKNAHNDGDDDDDDNYYYLNLSRTYNTQ